MPSACILIPVDVLVVSTLLWYIADKTRTLLSALCSTMLIQAYGYQFANL